MSLFAVYLLCRCAAMNVWVLILNVVACVRAQYPLDLGRFDVDVQIGTCKPRYRPISADDGLASTNAMTWILSFLPDYDPYKLNQVGPYTFESILASGKATASDIFVKGLGDLEIEDLEMRMYYDQQEQPYRLDLNISLPVVDVAANIDASLDFLFLPTDISGRVKIKLLGVHAEGSTCAAPKLISRQFVFQHNSLTATAHVDNVQVTMALDDFPLLDQELLLTVANSLKDSIADTVARKVLQKINEILKEIPSEDFEKLLLTPL